jgi:DNA-binding transcriptional MerR regulator
MPGPTGRKVWLTAVDLTERYPGTTIETIRYWKKTGYGPPGVKIGRRVFYDLAEVERWEAEQAAAQNPTSAA